MHANSTDFLVDLFQTNLPTFPKDLESDFFCRDRRSSSLAANRGGQRLEWKWRLHRDGPAACECHGDDFSKAESSGAGVLQWTLALLQRCRDVNFLWQWFALNLTLANIQIDCEDCVRYFFSDCIDLCFLWWMQWGTPTPSKKLPPWLSSSAPRTSVPVSAPPTMVVPQGTLAFRLKGT